MAQFKIRTPHAAVIIWNYDDRFGNESSSDNDVNRVEERILSTLSCISIETAKSKGNPVGSFQLVLAPLKNWVSTITTGSWCCILMSNNPITEDSLKRADPLQVKMIGKIETVRVDTNVNQADGSRQTRYLVGGTDWGHIFNNTLYVDNLLAAANDPAMQGNAAAVALRNALFGKGNSPQSFAVKDNLRSLLNIFGNNLKGFTDVGNDINRLAKSTYDFLIPQKMSEFLNFIGPDGRTSRELVISRILNVKTGKLSAYDTYDEKADSFGFIDPFSLQGNNSFWQILVDNSNPALNEMYNEINWGKDGPSLTLYNRIKPFSYKNNSNDAAVKGLRSKFQLVKTHQIENDTVIGVNAGTNWRDKYNFIEIKPQFQDFNIIGNWTKQKTQEKDERAFNREGFRPYIVGTKQFPVSPDGVGGPKFNPDMLKPWALLLREWFFDTHKLLNGTLTMTGTNEYIAVGNNIRFDANLINPNPNINKASNAAHKNSYILAHVESVSHSFSVNSEGARIYSTTIQFVRGITVNSNNTLVGEGSLDKFASGLLPSDDRNHVNTVSTSENDDPDPDKVRGT
jgi:hypothetical protein